MSYHSIPKVSPSLISPLEVPGKYASPLSMTPVKDAQSFAMRMHDYITQNQQLYGDHTVFRLHPGIKTIAVLDNISAEYVFKAPAEELDRDGLKRFGAFAAREELMLGAHPPVYAAGNTHKSVRALTEDIFALRDERLVIALEETIKKYVPRFEKADRLSFYDALLEFLLDFSFKWILDISPAYEDLSDWYKHLLYLETDTIAAKLVGKVAQPRCPRRAIAIAHNLKSQIQQSPFYGEYVELAKKYSVDEAGLAGVLLFNLVVNAAGGEMRSLFPSLAQISVNTEIKTRLSDEVKNLKTPEELNNNEYLDNFYYECLRHYPQPRFYYRVAKKDVVLPASNNRHYLIPKGEMLALMMPFVNRDPEIFSDADAFDPLRFERNPALKERLWPYGMTGNYENPYGCAALASGHAEKVWKMMVAKFGCEYEWKLSPHPEFTVNSFFDVRPKSMVMKGFMSISRKNIKKHELQPVSLTLEEEFEIVAGKVSSFEVSFSKSEYANLYGLYKQALVGDNTKKAPSVLSGFLRMKWSAWEKFKGLSSETAMKEYINVFKTKGKVKNQKEKTTAYKRNLPPKSQAEPSGNNRKKFLPVKIEEREKGELLTNYEMTFNFCPPNVSDGLYISFTVKGTKGQSSNIKFHLSQDVFEGRGTRQSKHLRFEIPDVGTPRMIELDIHHENKEELSMWYVEDIHLFIPEVESSYTFACFEHIPIPSKKFIIFDATGQIPQYDTPEMAEDREKELAQRRAFYQWGYDEQFDLPGCGSFEGYDHIPVDDQFEEKLLTVGASGLHKKKNLGISEKSWNIYHEVLKERKRTIPRLSHGELWKSDLEFGRAYLQGSHGNFLKRCEVLPSKMNLNEDFMVVSEESSLGELMQQRRVFVADYEIMDGIQTYEDRYISAPIVLLVARPTTNSIVPIAIQLSQDKASNPPVFTPQDSESDWLLAKMWAKLADGTYQQIISHFLLTHAVSESFALAAYRTLPSSHPVFKLVLPHIKHTLAIGVLAREYMVCEGGWIDKYGSIGGGQLKLMEKAFQKVSLHQALNFSMDLEKRGVIDENILPEYPYRDDGTLVWEALKEYVGAIINVYYRSDQDVLGDKCLQNWIAEFNTKGYKYSDLPNKFKTRQQLIELLTSTIFASTAIHGSMNFMQYESYAFQPASPVHLRIPPMTEKGTTSFDTLLEALPPLDIADGLVDISDFLSKRFPEDIALGSDDRRLFSHPDVKIAELRFKKVLEKIEGIIHKRNEKREVPYDIFLPSLIPNSVAL